MTFRYFVFARNFDNSQQLQICQKWKPQSSDDLLLPTRHILYTSNISGREKLSLFLKSSRHFCRWAGKVSTQEKRSSFVWGLQHVGMLANLFPACAAPPILIQFKRKYWMGSIVRRPQRTVCFFLQYKWVSIMMFWRVHKCYGWFSLIF